MSVKRLNDYLILVALVYKSGAPCQEAYYFVFDLKGKEPPVAPLKHEGMLPSEEASARHICQVCGDRVFIGQQQWLGEQTLYL